MTPGFLAVSYTFCVLDQLRTGLRRRDIFVSPSVRYADPRIGLLEGEVWDAARPFICRSLGLPAAADEALSSLQRELDETYRAVAKNLPNNPAVRIEKVNGQDDLILTGLDKLEEPFTLVKLAEQVGARMPRVDLPDILLEVATRTGFTKEFTHISERDSLVSDLTISICAVLTAKACNTENEPLAPPQPKALLAFEASTERTDRAYPAQAARGSRFPGSRPRRSLDLIWSAWWGPDRSGRKRDASG